MLKVGIWGLGLIAKAHVAAYMVLKENIQLSWWHVILMIEPLLK